MEADPSQIKCWKTNKWSAHGKWFTNTAPLNLLQTSLHTAMAAEIQGLEAKWGLISVPHTQGGNCAVNLKIDVSVTTEQKTSEPTFLWQRSTMTNVRLGLGTDPVEVQFRKRSWLKSTEPPAHLGVAIVWLIHYAMSFFLMLSMVNMTPLIKVS